MGVNSLAANPPPGVNLSPVSQLQPVIDAQEATSAAHSPWHAALMNPPKPFTPQSSLPSKVTYTGAQRRTYVLPPPTSEKQQLVSIVSVPALTS